MMHLKKGEIVKGDKIILSAVGSGWAWGFNGNKL